MKNLSNLTIFGSSLKLKRTIHWKWFNRMQCISTWLRPICTNNFIALLSLAISRTLDNGTLKIEHHCLYTTPVSLNHHYIEAFAEQNTREDQCNRLATRIDLGNSTCFRQQELSMATKERSPMQLDWNNNWLRQQSIDKSNKTFSKEDQCKRQQNVKEIYWQKGPMQLACNKNVLRQQNVKANQCDRLQQQLIGAIQHLESIKLHLDHNRIVLAWWSTFEHWNT